LSDVGIATTTWQDCNSRRERIPLCRQSCCNVL